MLNEVKSSHSNC